MTDESLYDFYEHAVLPQFGITDGAITWKGSRRVDADEFAHMFKRDNESYVLFFEDYADRALSETYIIDKLVTPNKSFEFVEPTSHSNIPPSYDGFKLAAPSRYCENVTGIFTLLKMIT